MFALPVLALTLASAVYPTVAIPQPRAAEFTLPCSLSVNGTLKLVDTDASITGAGFAGAQYDVNGDLAQLLKIFAPESFQFGFYACNSTFMGYTQNIVPAIVGDTFLYGQLRDVASGLCVSGDSLGGKQALFSSPRADELTMLHIRLCNQHIFRSTMLDPR